MYRVKIYSLIYLGMVLPLFLSAAPIDKYYVPPIQFQQQILQQQMPLQQQVPSTRAQIDEAAVYADFRSKVSKLSEKEREVLKSSFTNKMNSASNNKNFDEAKYYQKLIDILNKV